MEQYQEWEEENYPKKCPVHNCYIFHPINSPNYKPAQPSLAYKGGQYIPSKNIPKNNYKARQCDIYEQYNNNIQPESLLNKYGSTDGVLRGYNNNYSFYISGSSQIKPKVTINNQINNYTSQTMAQYPYQAGQINQSKNPSYIIMNKQPQIYNYNTSNFGGFKYNENQNKQINNINRVYQAPKIERRMVKRVIDKEPFDSRAGPRDNLRNNNTGQTKEMFHKINTNQNYRKYSGNQLNNNSYIVKRNTSPVNSKQNIITTNYSRPIVSNQRKISSQNQSYPYTKSSNNNITYDSNPYQYRMYTQQNKYQGYGNYPSNINNYSNYQKYNYSNNQREYGSRTEFPEQRNYKYEYEQEDYEEDDDDDEDVYEVPEQYNINNGMNMNNANGRREYYSERPFMRINNYSQSQRNGKKYTVYTQTLAMNRNFNEYEYEPNDRRYLNNNNFTTSNNYYSQPKYREGVRYGRQGNTAFEKSLRNIRLNNEEIEMENEQRNNNRVQIKTSGANNHRLYISNNSRSYPKKNYRTFTEMEAYRNQNYILQDIDDDDYDVYPNEKIVANNNRYNNLRIVKNENEEEIEDDDSDDEEKIYDTNKLIRAKEDNFNIIQQNKNSVNNKIESKTSKEENNLGYQQNEDFPHDNDEELPRQKNKNMKNIETEINEKYYDNQGNYLGEKKIITTKQVPIDDKNMDAQNEEDEEEQEDVEEYENINDNYQENEYHAYQSNNGKFQKRGENMNNIKSKYKSYFGDDNNNVYYEIRGDSKNTKNNTQKINYNINNNKNQNLQIKNVNFGIHSENLCVPAEENDDKEKDEHEEKDEKESDKDEKEADEQKLEEELGFDEEEEINDSHNNNNDNDNEKKNEEDNIKEEEENDKINDIDENNNNEHIEYEENINDKKEENENENEIINKENLDDKNILDNENNLNNEDNMQEEENHNEENNNNLEENENINMNNNNENELNDNNKKSHLNNEEENHENNNIDNNIISNEENQNLDQKIEENDNDEIEVQNIQKYEGIEEYGGEEEEIGEEMANMEYNENNYENNVEEEYGEGEEIMEENENNDFEEHVQYKENGEENE